MSPLHSWLHFARENGYADVQDLSSECRFCIACVASLSKAISGRPSATNVKLHYNGFYGGESIMPALTITAQGQVTFRKDISQHLGIAPGDKLELDKLPEGRVILRAVRSPGYIDSILGFLAGKTQKVATLDEIDKATDGWSGHK